MHLQQHEPRGGHLSPVRRQGAQGRRDPFVELQMLTLQGVGETLSEGTVGAASAVTTDAPQGAC